MVNKRASNIEVKKINRNMTFRYLNRLGRISKQEIASALGISLPTVMQNINELIKQGLVREVGEFKSTGGRKASALQTIRNGHNAVGIDITRDHIGLIVSDLSGEILIHKRINKLYKNNKQYYREMAETVLQFKNENINRGVTFLGYGISIPGIINQENNMIVYSHALGIRRISCEIFSEFIPEKCTFINDANAAGYAEIFHMEKSFNAAYLSLSNSVGGAIIQDKQNLLSDNPLGEKLYLGDNNRSSEFGHMCLYPHGGECYCGKRGCVDYYCSSNVLSNQTGGDLDAFFVQLEKRDTHIKNVWEEYLNNLSVAVNSLRMIFDCAVIIGGYVGSYINPYLDQLKEKAAKLNTFEEDASYIIPCTYKIESSALGAALLKVEGFINTI